MTIPQTSNLANLWVYIYMDYMKQAIIREVFCCSCAIFSRVCFIFLPCAVSKSNILLFYHVLTSCKSWSIGLYLGLEKFHCSSVVY